MKLTRIIPLICCIVFLCSCLSGCKNSENSENTKNSSVAESSQTEENSKAEPVYNAKHQLSDKNATPETKKLYDYICDNFGKKMLTAQQESTWKLGPNYEMDFIEENTGKLPAIRGMDFMNGDFAGVTERAIDWWHQEGGIVSICWHTGVEGAGYDEAMKEEPDFEKLLDENSEIHKKMIENWDKAAYSLSQLQDVYVPVLWRPFHEFDGGWFWWGKGGSENFRKLWKEMYNYFTNEKGLHNLIWVLPYSGEVKDGWYVGDDYCDIIGSDTYNCTTNKTGWEKLKKISTTKPLCFHECGIIPLPEEFEKDKDIWSWFMCWHTTHIKRNDKENLKKIYNSELMITLDELPDLKLKR